MRRSYGQYCGLARALEVVGERWALLIVRDLLVGPRRFTQLQQGLPRIPSNVLTNRLKELETYGVVQRRPLPRPAGGVVYELTERGRQLEPAVLSLGRWGAPLLDQPRPDEIVTVDALVMALRTAYQPARPHPPTTYEVRVGDLVVSAATGPDKLVTAAGSAPNPDLVIDTDLTIRALITGELAPADAIAGGWVRLTGDPALLTRFVDTFRIGPTGR